MERSEWPDDDAAGEGASDGETYPLAPLPAHERTWRHPSEMGRAVWTQVEPPITIGRGLLLTTGAIGGLLSLAVLWAMLPSTGRGGIAASTAVTSTANDLTSSLVTVRPDTLVATSLDVALPSTTVRAGISTVPQSDPSPTTTVDRPQPTESTQSSQLLQSPPIAVGIGDSLVVTTARAVRGRTSITLADADGNPHDATVLMVDSDLGLALLSPDAASITIFYGLGPVPSPGDVVTVLGSTPTSTNVVVDSDGRLTLDSWADSIAEGTPVLNSDGQLVGICSHGDSGPQLVSVVNVGAMLPPAKPTTLAAWLGVHVTAGELGLTVDRVAAEGPAAAVGLAVGDVITAIDGVPVVSVDELKSAIAARAPDDVITLTVTFADQSVGDVAVALVSAPSM